jgi:hypothetical protein
MCSTMRPSTQTMQTAGPLVRNSQAQIKKLALCN